MESGSIKSNGPASPKTSQQNEAPTEKPKPNIRTMKSDIDELMKGGRMTLGQMVGPGAKDNFYKTTDNKKYLLLIGVFLALVSIGVWIITRSGKEEPPGAKPSRLSVPAPLLATEVSRTITVKHQDRLQLFRLLEDSMKESELFGTTKRIIVKIQMPDLPAQAGGSERFLTFADFVDFYRLSPPKNLAQFLGGPLMVFVYYGENGSRLGLAAKTSDFDRTMLSMFSWEASLALDFRQLFFGVQFGEITGEFEDRTYRNIDWRFLKSPRTEDLGIGYTIFPARDVLVITTSKGAQEKAIDRLFEAK